MDRETIEAPGKEALNIVKKLLKQGNITKIVVKDQRGKVILNIPITVVAAGSLLAPIVAIAGFTLALVKKCSIDIERKKHLLGKVVGQLEMLNVLGD